MKFALLKEFLLGDTSQAAFAKKKNRHTGTIAQHLRIERNQLLHIEFIDNKDILEDKYRPIDAVRRNREKWLKAISNYEKAMPKSVKSMRYILTMYYELRAVDQVVPGMQQANAEESDEEMTVAEFNELYQYTFDLIKERHKKELAGKWLLFPTSHVLDKFRA